MLLKEDKHETKTNKNKFIGTSVLLLFGSAPVYAAESLSNSTGSAASDYNAARMISWALISRSRSKRVCRGPLKIPPQQKKASANLSPSMPHQASTYCVVIPKTIILDGIREWENIRLA
jgi:hypothetical protein